MMEFYSKTFSNKLRSLVIHDIDSLSVSILLLVRVGSRFENEETSGIAHFVEHTIFKGTKKRPKTKQIAMEVEQLGATMNAFTSYDYTGYYIKVPKEKFAGAFEVLADMFLNSTFKQEEIEKERGTIIQEINMYEDTPQRNIWDVFENFIYDGNTLGRDIVGSKKNVASLQRKNFVDYIKKHYTADRTIVCVAGKFDKKKIISETEKYFGSLQKGKGLQFEKIVEKQSKPAIKIKFKKNFRKNFNLQ